VPDPPRWVASGNRERGAQMKKLLQRIFFGVFGFVGLLIVIWLGAHLFTANSQWARAIAWGDSDIDDYKRFPMRVVSNAAPTFNFKRPSAETLRRYVPAFNSISYHSCPK
jgi:hypothetical protein